MKTQSYSSTPFAVVEGTRAIAEWLPDDKDGVFVSLKGDEIMRSQIFKIGDLELRSNPAFVRLVKAGVVGSPEDLDLTANYEYTYDRTVAYLRRAVWLSADMEYYAVASYVALTWAFQAFDCVPYLRFTGDFGVGKTTALKAVASLAYRPVVTTGVLRTAPIFRLADRLKSTFLFDEADFGTTSAVSDLFKLLNCGYSKGSPVIRLDSKYEPRMFDVFGPKVIAARELFADLALESRCLNIEMRSRNHGLEPLSSPAMQQEATAIRNGFLSVRLKNRIAPYPEDEEVIIERLLESRFDARVIQIALPLMHSTPDLHRETLADFLGGAKYNYRRLYRETIHGQILSAYLESGLERCRLTTIKKYLDVSSVQHTTLKSIAVAAVRMGFDKDHTREGAIISSPSDEWLTSVRRIYNV